MPVYNAWKFLSRAIASILNQSFHDFELLIIDDGSTDNSFEIIKSFTDSRIRYIKNETNEGVVAVRNKGILLSGTEYIAFLDADDYSLPERLAKQFYFLENNPTVSLLATRLELIDENDKYIGEWKEDAQAISDKEIETLLPRVNCIGQSTVMIRKSVIEKYKYSEKIWHSEDWGLWLTLLAEGHRISKFDEVLARYRIHSSSLTVRENQKGVQKKIIRFKKSYLSERFTKGRFRKTDYKVLSGLIYDLAKYTLPSFVFLPYKIYRKRPFKILCQFVNIALAFNKENKFNYIFFFPYFHLGGAEKVHVSILESVADKKPVVLITGVSNGEALLKDFKKNSVVLEVFYLLNFGLTRKWLTDKLIWMSERNNDLNLFGCNSKFYYELIPKISSSAICIDLIHAFVHTHEDGPEKWSLSNVSRLNRRVVINRKTVVDLTELYKENNISESLLKRIICIPNFTETSEYINKQNDGNLKIVYVGRGGKEKRIHLISKAAKLASQKGLSAEFHFVGDLKEIIPVEELKYCILHGEITEGIKLKNIYHQSHVLLMTSSREGFPIVIMEAMMNGVLPVSTNVGGISEHLEQNINGVLIDEIDPDKIVERILNIIEYFCNNRIKLNEMSMNAYNYALLNFNKDKFIESYRKFLVLD